MENQQEVQNCETILQTISSISFGEFDYEKIEFIKDLEPFEIKIIINEFFKNCKINNENNKKNDELNDDINFHNIHNNIDKLKCVFKKNKLICKLLSWIFKFVSKIKHENKEQKITIFEITDYVVLGIITSNFIYIKFSNGKSLIHKMPFKIHDLFILNFVEYPIPEELLIKYGLYEFKDLLLKPFIFPPNQTNENNSDENTNNFPIDSNGEINNT